MILTWNPASKSLSAWSPRNVNGRPSPLRSREEPQSAAPRSPTGERPLRSGPPAELAPVEKSVHSPLPSPHALRRVFTASTSQPQRSRHATVRRQTLSSAVSSASTTATGTFECPPSLRRHSSLPILSSTGPPFPAGFQSEKDPRQQRKERVAEYDRQRRASVTILAKEEKADGPGGNPKSRGNSKEAAEGLPPGPHAKGKAAQRRHTLEVLPQPLPPSKVKRSDSKDSIASGMSLDGRRMSSPLVQRRASQPSQLARRFLTVAGVENEEDRTPIRRELKQQKKRPFQLWKFAHENHIPLDFAKQAVALFREHAFLPQESSNAEDDFSEPDPDLLLQDGRLTMDKFKELMGQAPTNEQRLVDFPEFIVQYSCVGFSEEVVLSPQQKLLRSLARKHGVSYASIEHYRSLFDSFDANGSGEIEYGEFEKLMTKLVLTHGPAGMELPHNRLANLWNVVDLNNNGRLSFEEFTIFYTKYFSEESGSAALESFYARAAGMGRMGP